MHFPTRAAVLAALLFALPAVTPLAAQVNPRSIRLNVAAGASFPVSSLGDNVDVGYNVTVGLGSYQTGTPLGFRAEGSYNEWQFSGLDFKTHASSLTGNLTYDLNPTTIGGTGNTFYGIGGGGIYGTGNGGTDFGWNLGGGFRFPLSGFSAYLEARYHSVSNVNYKFVPVVFGLVF